MTDRCDTTELLVDQCAHCQHPQQPPTIRGRWREFTAMYPGRCAECGDEFRAGTWIGRLEDGGGYMCTSCLDEEDG